MFFSKIFSFFSLITRQPYCVAALLGLGILLFPVPAFAQHALVNLHWWQLIAMLFVFTFLLGILAVLAGVGGALIFVPVISLCFPLLHIDFIRATGLTMALTGALFAVPMLIRQQLVSLRLAILLGMLGSLGAIYGARIGLRLPVATLQLMIAAVLFIAISIYALRILRGRQAIDQSKPNQIVNDRLSWLKLATRLYDMPDQRWLYWQPRFLYYSLGLFVLVGFISGALGLGGGWAYVPILNLVMGLPLRFAVATSSLIIAIVNTATVPVYLKQGAVQPLLSIPCVLGMMLGARVGSRVLGKVDHYWLQWVVLLMLCLVGISILLKSLAG